MSRMQVYGGAHVVSAPESETLIGDHMQVNSDRHSHTAVA